MRQSRNGSLISFNPGIGTILGTENEGDERNSIGTVLEPSINIFGKTLGITVPPENISASTCLIPHVERHDTQSWARDSWVHSWALLDMNSKSRFRVVVLKNESQG